MQSIARESDDRVAHAYAFRPQHLRLGDRSHDKPGEVVVGGRVHAGHLGRFPADQRASVLDTSGRHTGDDRFDHRRLEFAEREIVEKKQRHRALDQDVVDAVVDQVMANRVVAPGLDRHLDLRSNAIGARDQHRGLTGGRHPKQAAEAAEAAPGGARGRGLDESPNPLLGIGRRVDVDAGRAVVERGRRGASTVRDAHRPAPPRSNETKSRNSVMR